MHGRTTLQIACLWAAVINLSEAWAQCGWQELYVDQQGDGQLSVAINPKDGDILYAGGSFTFFMMSRDAGQTWRRIPLPNGMIGLRMIVVHPVDTSSIIVGASGIWKSRDSGVTWTRVLDNVNFNGLSIVVDPLHTDSLYAGTLGQGFFASFDRGDTWTRVSETAELFCTIAIRPDSSNVFLGGTGLGTVAKSNDYGRTWRMVTARNSAEIPIIVFNPLKPSDVYATAFGLSGEEFGLIKSVDGGETWRGAGLHNLNIWALEVSSAAETVIYAGGFATQSDANSAGRVYVSRDDGNSWLTSSEGLPARSNIWMIRASRLNPSDVYLALGRETFSGGSVFQVISAESPPQPPGNLKSSEPGDGTSAIIRWNPSEFCTAPVRNYVVRYGARDGTFADSVDAGLDTSVTLSNLREGLRYYASVVAIDTAAKRSRPSAEITFVPESIPAAAKQLTWRYRLRGARFTWEPNIELDIAGYNLYRRTASANSFERVNSSLIATESYADSGLASQRHFYYLTAVDQTGNEGPPSTISSFSPITLDRGMLVIDETRDGNGSLASPSDEQVDNFYRRLLEGFSYSEYDVRSAGTPDDTLGAFSPLIWYGDLPTISSISGITEFLSDYIDAGGELLLGGWGMLRSLTSGAVHSFDEDEFGSRYLHLDSLRFTLEPQFKGAASALPEYGSISVDAGKVPIPSWQGLMRDIYVFSSDEATTLFTYTAEDENYAYNGRPVAVKYISSTHKVVVLGFPLYFIKEDEARLTLKTILEQEFGEVRSAVEEPRSSSNIPAHFELLQNYPNPFANATRLRFALPAAGRVRIEVFNLLGERVALVVDRDFSSGIHHGEFQSTLTSNGVYFYRMTVSQGGRIIHQQARKFVVMR